MKRHVLGILALVLLAVGAWYAWQGTHTTGQELLLASCLRIGAVLAVIWVAWPDLAKLPPFLCLVGGLSILVMLRWPQLVFYLLPIFIAIWLLRPRRGSSARPLSPRKPGAREPASRQQSQPVETERPAPEKPTRE